MTTTETRRDYALARIKLLAALHYGCRSDELRPLFLAVKNNTDNSYATASLDEPSKVAYSRPDVDKYDRQRRTRLRVTKWLTRLNTDHNLGIAEAALHVAALVVGERLCPMEVAIHTGEALQSVFEEGVGGSSCMTHDCAEYVELWAANPDIVGVITAKDSKGHHSRALIWFLGDGNGGHWVDRRYPNNGVLNAPLVSWAHNQGHYVRVSNGYPTGSVAFENKEGERSGTTTVRLDCVGINLFPYSDSFHWIEDYDEYCGFIDITNSCNSCADKLSSTCGEITITDDDSCRCERCGDAIDEEDSPTHDGHMYCQCCFEGNFTHCEDIDEYRHNDDCVYVEEGYSVTLEGAFECEHCNDFFDVQNEHCIGADSIRCCGGCFEELTTEEEADIEDSQGPFPAPLSEGGDQ